MLAIFVASNDRHRAASTYHQLGGVAQEQRRFTEAEDAYKKALEIFVEFNDEHYGSIVLRSLARLWRATGSASIPSAVATTLKIETEQARAMLEEWREETVEPMPSQSRRSRETTCHRRLVETGHERKGAGLPDYALGREEWGSQAFRCASTQRFGSRRPESSTSAKSAQSLKRTSRLRGAARHLSYVAAANELDVTSAAVGNLVRGLEAAQRRLDQNPQAMRVRRETLEHPFGTMKARMGATHFLTKTLPKVVTEMALSVLAYNLTGVMNIVGTRALIAAIEA